MKNLIFTTLKLWKYLIKIWFFRLSSIESIWSFRTWVVKLFDGKSWCFRLLSIKKVWLKNRIFSILELWKCFMDNFIFTTLEWWKYLTENLIFRHSSDENIYWRIWFFRRWMIEIFPTLERIWTEIWFFGSRLMKIIDGKSDFFDSRAMIIFDKVFDSLDNRALKIFDEILIFVMIFITIFKWKIDFPNFIVTRLFNE